MDTRFFAHRGSSHKYSENTRAAYAQAIDEGADGVECDVHLSQDGIVVCHHDPTVDRTSDEVGAVSNYTVDGLKALDFTGVVPSTIPDSYGSEREQLLTLSELLDLLESCGRPIDLAVEIKHPSAVGLLLEDQVLKVLSDHGFDPTTGRAGAGGNIHVTLMSFEPASIRYLSQHVDRQLLCQLMTEISPQRVEDLLESGQVLKAGAYKVMQRSVAEGVELINDGRAGIIGPGIAWVRANEPMVRKWLARGLNARIWTVDRAADAQYLIDLGIREITSNRPAELRKELEYNES